MKIPNQKKIWDKIAQEWHDFRDKPSEHTLKFLKKQSGDVLDLGSGSGRYLTKIKNEKMHLVDFSEKMIELAEKKAKSKKISAEFFVSDMIKLPFKDNFFNGAIANSSIHCIEGKVNRKKTVKELYRVLKPGAQAEISVWNKNSKRFKNSPKERFVRWRDKGKRYYYLFEPEEIYKLFENIGFKIIEKEVPQRMIIFIVEKPKD
ncbi:MAG: class I SAM-dependent methyltransferase [Candidatus Nanoarchaeia archaeon]